MDLLVEFRYRVKGNPLTDDTIAGDHLSIYFDLLKSDLLLVGPLECDIFLQ